MKYDFQAIEKKWQARWEEEKPFAAVTGDPRPKFYGLIEFPYPSGQGLHVGHPRPFTAMDIICRKRRMQGYNVLFPIGFDAFGLPTENYAIKNHIHPAVVTKNNIANFTKQLKMLGYSFDWDRAVDTTDPSYYKWTQWIFLQMYKHGLAYKTTMPVNWCTSCKCVLANEEVVNGVCERCGSEVVRKEKSQWMLAITKYAQRLIDDLDDVDYIERVKTQQRNWIGRSTGAEITFKTNVGDDITVYTTRADTLFGTTYMVISPEHPLLKQWQPHIANWDAVAAYQEEAAHKSDFERGELNKEKTGVRLEGIEVMNPVTHKALPMFVSDYVLMGYGTGIVMGVPGHDQRDWEFATKFGLPIVEVVAGGDVTKEAFVAKDDSAVMVNSGFLNGMTVKEAIPAMKKYVVEQGFGKEKVNYKLRDWVFSRQRYWGEPIPLVNCPKCGWVPIPEDQLPLVLPQVDSYEPTDDGESPLSKMTDWVNTTCPQCGGPAKRETDTMPQWAGSSWYFLRYMDPHNDKALASKEALDYWSPVDWYNGGMEHTTLHLLYSRFWHKFLYDIGVVPTKEPYQKRTSHGMILGEGGEKMSKSRGNVVNPNDIVDQYGADTMRLHIMFIGDFEKAVTWSNEAVKGSKRFLDRVWNLAESCTDDPAISDKNEAIIHKTIKKVTEDIDELKMNTAIASMMTMVNEFAANGCTKGDMEQLLLLLSPFAPHIVEELWERLGFAAKYGKMCCQCDWPTYDETKTVDTTVTMAVQVLGKLKGTVTVAKDSDQQTVVDVGGAARPGVAAARGDAHLINFIRFDFHSVFPFRGSAARDVIKDLLDRFAVQPHLLKIHAFGVVIPAHHGLGQGDVRIRDRRGDAGQTAQLRDREKAGADILVHVPVVERGGRFDELVGFALLAGLVGIVGFRRLLRGGPGVIKHSAEVVELKPVRLRNGQTLLVHHADDLADGRSHAVIVEAEVAAGMLDPSGVEHDARRMEHGVDVAERGLQHIAACDDIRIRLADDLQHGFGILRREHADGDRLIAAAYVHARFARFAGDVAERVRLGDAAPAQNVRRAQRAAGVTGIHIEHGVATQIRFHGVEIALVTGAGNVHHDEIGAGNGLLHRV